MQIRAGAVFIEKSVAIEVDRDTPESGFGDDQSAVILRDGAIGSLARRIVVSRSALRADQHLWRDMLDRPNAHARRNAFAVDLVHPEQDRMLRGAEIGRSAQRIRPRILIDRQPKRREQALIGTWCIAITAAKIRIAA